MDLYVTDLDGTLLRSDKTLSEFTVSTLNSLIDGGVKIAYATARSFNSASKLVRDIHFSEPCAVYNGVMTVDPKSGGVLSTARFSDRATKLARELFELEKIFPIVYSYIGGEHKVSYVPSGSRAAKFYLDDHRDDPRMRCVNSFDELFEGEMFYFTVISEKADERITKHFTAENGFFVNVQKDSYDEMIWHEICDASCSKASAALRLKTLCGADRLVCIGDNFNDIPMMRAADISAAVENAPDEVKSAADIVIGANDSDGCAEFIAGREKQKNSSALEK